MPIQQARQANLCALVATLRASGVSTPSGQVKVLGPALTEARLHRMLAGAAIPSLTARAIEHRLHKPKGWMDTCESPRA
jgi:hypothetical protein